MVYSCIFFFINLIKLLRAQLEELNQQIQQETTMVMNELSKVEPAVRDAKAAVQSIRKQHLVEIRSMANPPAGTLTLNKSCRICTAIVHPLLFF